MSLFHFELHWPGGGHFFSRECADMEAAAMLARFKVRKHKDATWVVTERPDEAANDSALADTGPWPTPEGKPLPIPAGPSLEHAFAPGSPEYFEQVEGEARAVVREAKPERHTWNAL